MLRALVKLDLPACLDAAAVNADGEMALDDPAWDDGIIADRFRHYSSIMSGLARVLGFDGQSFPGASPFRTAEAALSVTWVNNDLADPDEFNAQSRVFEMAAAGADYAFTKAGASTFGRAAGECDE